MAIKCYQKNASRASAVNTCPALATEPLIRRAPMVENIITRIRDHFESAGAVRRRPSPVEIPQEPRFAVQRLVDDESRTIAFNDGAFDDPSHRQLPLYQ